MSAGSPLRAPTKYREHGTTFDRTHVFLKD